MEISRLLQHEIDFLSRGASIKYVRSEGGGGSRQ